MGKAGRPQKWTAEQMIDAIRKAQTAAGAARIIGCSSDTIRTYANRYPTVAAALHTEREDLIDYAEEGLKNAVINGEAWAIAFALKTIGKHRGYTERTEITGADGEGLKVIIEYADRKANIPESA